MAPREDQKERNWEEIAESDLEHPDVQQRLAEGPAEFLSPEMQRIKKEVELEVNINE